MTFEPDWTKLERTYFHADMGCCRIPGDNDGVANSEQIRRVAIYAVITEYQDQLAQAGLVVVRREDAHYLAAVARDICDGFKPLATQELRNASNRMFDAALAATPKPAPGGDG